MLGSRIFDGRVPPLLASRLDRGIGVYNQRVRLGEDPSLMVCCGGQGPDEDRAEAEAMADYLLDHGIPESVIRREDKSTTTEENLLFGSRIVRDEVGAVPLLTHPQCPATRPTPKTRGERWPTPSNRSQPSSTSSMVV